MGGRVLAYTTKELSKRTWPDFARLFSQGNGWDFCWCMHFQRARSLTKGKRLRRRAERGVRNRREKKEMVESGRSHGILVYVEGEPVGWCQYGLKEELPRIDNSRNYRVLGRELARGLGRGLAVKGKAQRLWRITCFVVDKKYRRRGIAAAALKAALKAIRKKGGGVVEG